MKISFFILLFLFSNHLFSKDRAFELCRTSIFDDNESFNNSKSINDEHKEENEGAWWTGPLLASSAINVPKGDVVFSTYLLYYRNYGIYDRNWNIVKTPVLNTLNGFFSIQTGLTDRLEATFYFQFFYNWMLNHQYFGFGDSYLRLKYRLTPIDSKGPVFSLFLQEIFPTGSYNHLNPDFLSFDGTGGGAWVTDIGFYLEDTVKLSDEKWFRWYVNCSFGIPVSVKIDGVSVYGTGRGASGEILPGKSFFVIAAFERQITQNWVLALDITYRHNAKSTFNGYPGFNRLGQIDKAGLPSSESITLAPAIEYNIDAKKGVIAGIWFTALGRNSVAFCTPTIAGYLYF